MGDNYSLWEQHDRDMERELERCPKCDCCGEYIQDEYLYLIDGEILCLDCLNDQYRKDAEAFME